MFETFKEYFCCTDYYIYQVCGFLSHDINLNVVVIMIDLVVPVLTIKFGFLIVLMKTLVCLKITPELIRYYLP